MARKRTLSRETILYLIFGLMTTVVNYTVFYVCYHYIFSSIRGIASNAVSFVFAVIFAYVTNKLFVFESKSWNLSILKVEIPKFFSVRLLSFLLEEAGILICDDVLNLSRFIVFYSHTLLIDGVVLAKIILSVIVVIINYIFCKFYIFKK